MSFITFPNKTEQEEISQGVQAVSNLTGCVGFIDELNQTFNSTRKRQ